MIVSHKHKFIFLKTNKTAGTSIEIALSKFCGPDDIITPISPVDEETRQSLGYRGPQHHLAPWYEYGLRDVVELVFKGKRRSRFYNHMTGREVRDFVGPEVWNSYFKFCFERNPYDRLISYYHWAHRSASSQLPLSRFIRTPRAMMLKKRGYEVYTLDGKVAVDRICRFESINEELEEVRRIIGLPEPLELPHTKVRKRSDARGYREVLGEEERDWVDRTFGDEMRLLGYHY